MAKKHHEPHIFLSKSATLQGFCATPGCGVGMDPVLGLWGWWP